MTMTVNEDPILALRRIDVDEELLLDYRFSNEIPSVPCYCGATNCRSFALRELPVTEQAADCTDYAESGSNKRCLRFRIPRNPCHPRLVFFCSAKPIVAGQLTQIAAGCNASPISVMTETAESWPL